MNINKKIHIITFANKKFIQNYDDINHSFKKKGITKNDITLYDLNWVKYNSNYYNDNKKIFDSVRGAGYWAWKPLIIIDKLNKVSDGEIVIYQDCGKGFIYKPFLFPKNILSLVEKNNFCCGVNIAEYGYNYKWSKPSLISKIYFGGKAFLDNSFQVQATWSFWKKVKESFDYLYKWRDICLNYDNISDNRINDDKNCEFLIDHRHDQSINTLIANQMYDNNRTIFIKSDKIIPFNKSFSFVELYLRFKENYFFNFFIIMLRLLYLLRAKLLSIKFSFFQK